MVTSSILKFRIKELEKENAQLKRALQRASKKITASSTSYSDDYEDKATKFMRTREY